MPRSIRPHSPVGGPVSVTKRPHIIGVSDKETTAEMAMATVSTTANSWNKRPSSPPMNRIGMNTATSEMLIEITVKPICRAPANAACSGFMPRSWKR